MLPINMNIAYSKQMHKQMIVRKTIWETKKIIYKNKMYQANQHKIFVSGQ